MAFVAEFTIPAEAFAVGRAFAESRVDALELDRVVPTGDAVVPFVWAWGGDLDAYERRLAAEPDVDALDVLADADGGRLYRVEWNDDHSGVLRELLDVEFTLLSGVCTADGWTFELRFQSSDAATAFRRRLATLDVAYDLTRIATIGCSRDSAYGLTPEQREILAVAAERGYFEEPRRATLSEIADELGISTSSASGRLRRAHDALVQSTVLSDAPRIRPSHRH